MNKRGSKYNYISSEQLRGVGEAVADNNVLGDTAIAM
jgi:hypothetical protein